MTKSEEKYWNEYKEKRQKDIVEAFADARYAYSRAIDYAKDLGFQQGKAETLLEMAKNYTASKTDDYYDLLENPAYTWQDGEED